MEEGTHKMVSGVGSMFSHLGSVFGGFREAASGAFGMVKPISRTINTRGEEIRSGKWESSDVVWAIFFVIIALTLIGMCIYEFFWTKRMCWAAIYGISFVIICGIYWIFFLQNSSTNNKANNPDAHPTSDSGHK